MTTARSVPKTPPPVAFPDPPQRLPEDVTTFNQLNVTGGAYLLTKHFGNPDTTLVSDEHYVSPHPPATWPAYAIPTC